MKGFSFLDNTTAYETMPAINGRTRCPFFAPDVGTQNGRFHVVVRSLAMELKGFGA